MPAKTRKDLFQELKKGTVEPVYFLYGPEAYLRQQAVRAITDEALRGTLLREFNESSFSLASSDVRSAIAAAEQLPMMSARRVVRLRDFAKLPEADEEFLLKYLERPVESSVVIFAGDDIDKRKKLAKTLMQRAAFEFQTLKSQELAAWVKSHLKKLNVEIDPQAWQRLSEVMGSDLYMVANELNKLATAAIPSNRITVELVEALATRSREHQNYELADQLLARNGKAALRVLKDLLDDGVPAVLLIGLIAGTYRRLTLAKELQNQGATPREIFSQVPMPPFKQSSYLSILGRLNSDTLARRIQRIAEADLGIKTSMATPRMQVEMLVCELVG